MKTLGMIDAMSFVGVVFSGLSALVIEDAGDAGEVICVRGRTRDGAVACPGCGTEAGRVRGSRERTAAGVPAGGRRVVVKLRARRMRCPVLGCGVQAFCGQVPGVAGRYQRRAVRRAGQAEAAVRALAGRAGARLLAALGVGVSGHTALRVLPAVPLPGPGVPRVPGIDDFALRKGRACAAILIDAGTGRRVDVLEGRTAGAAGDWLRAHPGVGIVTRGGSGAYGEAVRSALPDAVRCGDRWHLWHLLCEAAAEEAAAHCACRAAGAPMREGKRAGTTRERWRQVHDLPSQGAGLPGCARRLGVTLTTVKRHDRASEPGRSQRVRKYRPALVDPYRDYLRERREEEPGVAVQLLLREIREPGYPGSSSLLVRCLNQGRAGAGRPHLPPRRATRILLTRPDNRTGAQRETAERLAPACPEMTAPDDLTGSFAAMLVPGPANEEKLQRRIAAARAAGLPHLRSFARGLEPGLKAATAAVTLPHHNGRTEGVSTKTKKIKRDMFGRAGSELLRHRILPGLGHLPSPPELRQSRIPDATPPHCHSANRRHPLPPSQC